MNGRGDIVKGVFRWQGPLGDPQTALTTMAGQLRGLDAALHSLTGRNARPSNPTAEWRAEDLPAFVVPRRRPRRLSLSGAGLSFRRNALVHHRVLPLALKDCELCFEWVDEHSERDEEDWRRPLGAAMFKPFGLTLEQISDDGGFIVSGNNPSPLEAMVDEQLRQADRDDCLALVWPELSLPPARQRQVTEALKARSGDLNHDAFSVSLLVLGSWHEAGRDGHRNVARIVDLHGEEIASHEKVMPYRMNRAKPPSGKWQPRREAIVKGRQLTVLVMEDRLVAVVICRDLCDKCGHTPFEALDVDLVLVPSLGNETTLDGHADRAQLLSILFDTQVFVSQHPQLKGQVPGAAMVGFSCLQRSRATRTRAPCR